MSYPSSSSSKQWDPNPAIRIKPIDNLKWISTHTSTRKLSSCKQYLFKEESDPIASYCCLYVALNEITKASVHHCAHHLRMMRRVKLNPNTEYFPTKIPNKFRISTGG